ncbi:MAG TPA: aminotransferase class V-fold PLP-dependent enzyme, partial [Acetobacteraceae bacterium]|nr:aminotransferase class V-fold PLP-dependent enzyme [Acetobacteraceae bacterium]
SVAVLMLTHVNYRSGRMHDMARLTRAAHEAGALVVWDLAHSAGAVPLDLADCAADFAVGCGYKFLNGGPGAPGFLYVAPRHQGAAMPLTGWMGHAEPFAFAPAYRPAEGIGRALVGTPHILSLAALEVGVDIALAADMGAVRAKSVRMAELFMALVERDCGGVGFMVASPRAAASRGSQVCLRHASAAAIMRALIGRGVIGDFRPPDVLRFGLTPLYLRYADLGEAVRVLAEVARAA